jgi:SAM-dependent methyltransferase
MKEIEWWQSFFGEAFFNFELKSKEREIKAKKEVNFILKVLKIPKDALILDLACGAGRHSIELARRGYRVVGIDFKKDYINYCKEKAKKLSLDNVKFMQGDMRRLNFKNKFDFVISIYTSFGYFSDEENLKVLKRIANALKKGGKLLIDVNNRDFLIKHFGKKGFTKLKEGYILEERNFDLSASVITTKWTFLSRNKKKISVSKTVSRAYSYHELKNMLEKVGLKVIKSFGSFKSEKVSFDSNRLILVGQKG